MGRDSSVFIQDVSVCYGKVMAVFLYRMSVFVMGKG